MPIVNGVYKNPNWVDDGLPAIDAAELNAISQTLEDLDEKNNTSTSLVASNWQDGIYDLSELYPDTYNVSIRLAPTCTKEQYEAWGRAMIITGETGNSLKALGEVPTIDIPVELQGGKA